MVDDDGVAGVEELACEHHVPRFAANTSAPAGALMSMPECGLFGCALNTRRNPNEGPSSPTAGRTKALVQRRSGVTRAQSASSSFAS